MVDDTELIKLAEHKAQHLRNGQSIRLTAEKTSYWIFDIQNFKYIGYYVNDNDCPQESFFKHKTVFETKTNNGSKIRMQRLI